MFKLINRRYWIVLYHVTNPCLKWIKINVCDLPLPGNVFQSGRNAEQLLYSKCILSYSKLILQLVGSCASFHMVLAGHQCWWRKQVIMFLCLFSDWRIICSCWCHGIILQVMLFPSVFSLQVTPWNQFYTRTDFHYLIRLNSCLK